MVLPLIPIAIAGLAGGGGFGLGSLLGKGKKEIHAPQEYYAPTISEVYSPTHAPQLQFAPVSTYGYQGATYIISSPGAVSKKEQIMDIVSEPGQKGAWDFPIGVTQSPTHAPGDVSGTNLPLIVGITVVGAVAIIFMKKKKGEKK